MKTIIFDFDGVILDSFETVFKVLSNLHQQFGLPTLTEEKLSDLFDGNFWENHKALGLSEVSENKLKNELKEALSRSQSDMPFFDGIKEVLRKLATDFELIILSSNHRENIKGRLVQEGIHDLFKNIFGTENSVNKKETVEKIITETEGSVIFVTDTQGDLLEVSSLDVIKVGVTWGYHSKDRLLGAHPDRIVDTSEELFEILVSI